MQCAYKVLVKSLRFLGLYRKQFLGLFIALCFFDYSTAPERFTFLEESLLLHTQLESYDDGHERVNGKTIGCYTLGCD